MARIPPAAIAPFLFLPATLLAQQSPQPQRLTADDVVPAVWGVLETPTTPGPHPGVIILPGSAGWAPGRGYAQIARVLADSGFVALAIDYFAVTGRDTSSAEARARWPTWEATVRNAVAYLRASRAVGKRPIGLIGYSRGAFLAVAMAGSLKPVKAVVDYFGGGGSGNASLEEQVRGFPPILILHGEADQVVPVETAYRLRDALLAEHRQVEIHVYPGAGHGFNAPGTPVYDEAAAHDAARRTIDFLRKRLGR